MYHDIMYVHACMFVCVFVCVCVVCVCVCVCVCAVCTACSNSVNVLRPCMRMQSAGDHEQLLQSLCCEYCCVYYYYTRITSVLHSVKKASVAQSCTHGCQD